MKKITPPRLAALCIVLLAALCWSLPTPTGLAPAAYHTAILFIATILVIVTNIAPTGYIAIISLTLYAVLRAGGEATPKAAIDGALVDFNHPLIWLIVMASGAVSCQLLARFSDEQPSESATQQED